MTVRLLLASRNAHKLAELGRMLGPGAALEALPDGVEMPPETGETFADNALLKARAAAAASGRPAIADDSGIAAAALGGAPGVRSARFAGERATDEENLALLVTLVPPASGLEYVCVIAYADPVGGEERLFEGRCEGAMAAARRGSGGFGYDPVFVPAAGDGRTMAELDAAEKDAISHRGIAVRAFAAWYGGGR